MTRCDSCRNATRDLLVALGVPGQDYRAWQRAYNAMHRRHCAPPPPGQVQYDYPAPPEAAPHG